MKKPLKIAVAAAIAHIGLLHTTGALAGGTSFTEQGASGLGNSYAGMSSAAEDASVLYWNPAALTRFKRAELVGGLLVAQLATPYTNSSNPPCEQADFTPNDPASQQGASRGTSGQPAGGNCTRSGAPGQKFERDRPARVAIPFNFAAIPLNDRTVMGFGVSGSSGLIVRFPSDSPGRTSAESTDLKVVRLTGGLGYKLTPTISLGGSFGYERMFTSIRARLNYRAAVDRAVAPGATDLVLQPGEPEETSIRITVYGWAVNGQIGGLWEPSERTRVGFGFRPKTTFENQGQLVIDSFPSQLGPGGSFNSVVPPSQAVLLKNFQEVRQRITLPSELNMSVFHSFTPKLDMMASWLREDFTDTEVKFTTTDGQIVQNPRQRFQVTNRYAIGGNYKYAKRLTLRAGFAKENAAIKDEDRLQSLPDNDRTFFNVGARWKIDRSMALDVGYQKIRFKEGVVGLNPQETDVVYNGKIKLDVDIIGIQLVDQF
jgi:long-chain fatty acid transport protein